MVPGDPADMLRLGELSAVGEINGVSLGWRCVAEADDSRGNHGIRELDVHRVEAMNSKEGDLAAQVFLKSTTVVDVHEFTRDEPDGQGVFRHQCVGKSNEVAIETGQPIKVHTRSSNRSHPESLLECGVQMVMSDIGWIADHEIGLVLIAGGWGGSGEIIENQVERGVCPKILRGAAVMRVDFVTLGPVDSILREAAQKGGVECACAERRIEEADRKSTRLNSSHIPLSRMPSSA